MFTAAAESRETAVSITEGLLCCSTVMFGHSLLQMGVAFVCMKRILRQYAWASQVYVSKTPYVKCRSVYVCVCRCCAAQTWLFGGTDRQPQRGFSTGCSFLPDSSVTHHYILLKAVRATVTFYAAFEFPAPMFFSICGCMFRIVCLSCLYCLLFHELSGFTSPLESIRWVFQRAVWFTVNFLVTESDLLYIYIHFTLLYKHSCMDT